MAAILPNLNPIQIETLTESLPMSEGAVSAIGGLANGLLQVLFPVGSIIYSMLTQAQISNSINNPTPQIWKLADGSDVTGSAYAVLTGNTLLPDLRGIFVRGVNGGATAINPDGTLPLGTYTADRFGSHQHQFSVSQLNISLNVITAPVSLETTIDTPTFFNTSNLTNASGGNDTAPTNVTVNIFIRIN